MVGHAEWDAAHCLWIRQPLRGELGSNHECVHKQWLLAAGTLFRNTLHLIRLWWQRAVKAATQTHHSSSLDHAETLDRTWVKDTTDDIRHETSCQMYILTPFLMAGWGWGGSSVSVWSPVFTSVCSILTSWCRQTDEQSFQRLRSLRELIQCLLNQNPAVEFKLHNLKRKVYGLKWCWLFFFFLLAMWSKWNRNKLQPTAKILATCIMGSEGEKICIGSETYKCKCKDKQC